MPPDFSLHSTPNISCTTWEITCTMWYITVIHVILYVIHIDTYMIWWYSPLCITLKYKPWLYFLEWVIGTFLFLEFSVEHDLAYIVI